MKVRKMNSKVTRLGVALLTLFVGYGSMRLISCGSGPTDPTPGPTATTPPPFQDLLVKVQGMRFVDRLGNALPLKWFAGCCENQRGEVPVDWSWISKAYMDYIQPLYGGENLVIYVRPGPWTPQSDFPPALLAVGGPYVVVDGKADLTQWNQSYFSHWREVIHYGGERHIRFMIDLCDGWACKQGESAMERISPGYHPWIAKNNLQGIDAYSSCGKGPINSIQEAWIRKLIKEFGEFSNVMFQVGNENELIPGYNQDWEATIINAAHDEELVNGYERHIFGTNAARTTGIIPQVDFVTIHTSSPMTPAQCAVSKPCVNTEYNPNPALTPATLKALACDAERKGFYWGYWRDGQDTKQSEETWRLLKDPCPTSTGCLDIPDQQDGIFLVQPKPPSRYTTEVNKTLKALSPSGEEINYEVKIPQRDFLPLFAQKARELFPSLCIGIQHDFHGEVDQVCFGSPKECQNYKVFSCRTVSCPPSNPDCGCDVGNTNPAPFSVRDTWGLP